MNDQASRLREVVADKSEYDIRSMSYSRSMEVITITSGKGGVGKTNFAVNFAIALAKRGKRVIIMDADFGLANVDLVLGMRSKYDITDLLSGEKTVNEVMVKGYEGIKFISGGSGLTELLNITDGQLERLMSNIACLEKETDILIIDTGAGVSDRVLRMVNASDETLLVITPEPTSIMDAFAVIKIMVAENKLHKIRIIVNRADNEEEAKIIAENFIDVVEKFLGVRIGSLGFIPMDRSVVQAIKNQIPFIVESPLGDAARQVNNIADDYLSIPRSDKSEKGGFIGFMKNLIKKR